MIDCDPSDTVSFGGTYVYMYRVVQGATAFGGQSWISTWDTAAIGSDWTKPAAWPTDAPTWTTLQTGKCGSAWTAANDCAGITAWAFDSAQTAPSSTAQGHATGYHWLADKKPDDATKLFQIEDGATIQVMINVHNGAD